MRDTKLIRNGKKILQEFKASARMKRREELTDVAAV